MIAGGTSRSEALDFDAVFGALFTLAYRIGFRLLGSRQDAEDIAQEALARAYMKWHVVGSTSPHAWVSVVAANLAVDMGRRRSRRRRDADPVRNGNGEAATVDRLALRDVLASLSGRQREVLVLRYVADLAEVDVAAALGVSVGAVKQHASRGCEHVRRRLGADWNEEENGVRALG